SDATVSYSHLLRCGIRFQFCQPHRIGILSPPLWDRIPILSDPTGPESHLVRCGIGFQSCQPDTTGPESYPTVTESFSSSGHHMASRCNQPLASSPSGG